MNPRLSKLQSLLAADPADTFVLYALAQEYAKAGEHTTAVGYFDRTLAVDPEYCYAYFHKARSLQALGDLARARQTVADGLHAAHRANDQKALGELSGLQVELAEG